MPEAEFAAVLAAAGPVLAQTATAKALRCALDRDRRFVADCLDRFENDHALTNDSGGGSVAGGGGGGGGGGGLRGMLERTGRVWVDCGLKPLCQRLEAALEDGKGRCVVVAAVSVVVAVVVVVVVIIPSSGFVIVVILTHSLTHSFHSLSTNLLRTQSASQIDS